MCNYDEVKVVKNSEINHRVCIRNTINCFLWNVLASTIFVLLLCFIHSIVSLTVLGTDTTPEKVETAQIILLVLDIILGLCYLLCFFITIYNTIRGNILANQYDRNIKL
jgi:hypothetical protein